MPLLFSPVYSPTHLLQLQSFLLFRVRLGRCPSPTLWWSVLHFSCCYKPSSLHAYWEVTPHPPSLAGLFIYSSCEGVPLPSSTRWSKPHFSHCYKLSPLQGWWAGATVPAFSHQLVYLQFEWGVPLPHSPELRVPRPLCYMSFFFSCLFIIQFVFFFFPWVGVGLSRGLCWSGPGLSVGVLHAASLTLWSASSQAIWVLVSGGSTGTIPVSPFNVEWEC
jgi:hypothetical protein